VLTVPEVARRIDRHPETVRRWIREGKLRSRKVGTQHFIEEADLALTFEDDSLPVPESWSRTFNGEPMPDVVRIIRRHRSAR
jgi:excisionase family DNA binding protein